MMMMIRRQQQQQQDPPPPPTNHPSPPPKDSNHNYNNAQQRRQRRRSLLSQSLRFPSFPTTTTNPITKVLGVLLALVFTFQAWLCLHHPPQQQPLLELSHHPLLELSQRSSVVPPQSSSIHTLLLHQQQPQPPSLQQQQQQGQQQGQQQQQGHAVPSSKPPPESARLAKKNAHLSNNNNNNMDNNLLHDKDVDNDTHPPFLPQWIAQYIAWHQQMRASFPGTALFDDPKAPKLLIRTCLGLCGGLHDRLGQLPWDLWLANQTQRLLLIHWHRPVPLEHFLTPPLGNSKWALDWTVPKDMPGFFPQRPNQRTVSREELRPFRAKYKDLFEGFAADRPTDTFFDQDLDAALRRATTGAFSNETVLRHRLLGHLRQDVLEQRLRQAGETDLIHTTPTFGRLFQNVFFQPSSAVATQIATVQRELGLHPNKYTAVHCRVRHPKATPLHQNVQGKDASHPADKTGLPWTGDTRDFAIRTATYALQCAEDLLTTTNNRTTTMTTRQQEQPQEPIYFLSDSNDLVHYVSHQLYDEDFVSSHQAEWSNNNASSADFSAWQFVRNHSNHNLRIVARNATLENAHLDKQKGRAPPEYYGTFVDLYLAMHARCVVLGIGFFAAFAAQVSGTTCVRLYQDEAWGGSMVKRQRIPACPLPPPEGIPTFL